MNRYQNSVDPINSLHPQFSIQKAGKEGDEMVLRNYFRSGNLLPVLAETHTSQSVWKSAASKDIELKESSTTKQAY